MDTPRDLSKPLRTALIACIILSIASVPVTATLFQDDFEDGDVNGWNGGEIDSLSTEGDWSLRESTDSIVKWTDGPTIQSQSNTRIEATIRTDGSGFAAAGTFIVAPDASDSINLRMDTSGNQFVFADFNEQVFVSGASADTWYNINITMDGGTAHFKKWEVGSSEPQNFQESVTLDGDYSGDVAVTSDDTAVNYYLDSVVVETDYKQSSLSGEVVDEDDDAIYNATIEVVNTTSGSTVQTVQTNSVGQYSVSLDDGEYNVTASKDGYLTETKPVTISGSDETLDFQLTSVNASIELDARNFLEHGESSPYTVVVDNGTGRADVTNSTNLTVTSNDTSIVTVDTINNELVATSDISVNNRTFITAEYQDPDGTTYTATQNVTVANVSVENLKILPTGPRLEAAMGANSDEDPTADTIPVIIVAMILGAGVTIFARSFAGLMAATLVITLGWIGGMVGNGMIIVTVVTALMIGLNVATNVDYSIRT